MQKMCKNAPHLICDELSRVRAATEAGAITLYSLLKPKHHFTANTTDSAFMKSEETFSYLSVNILDYVGINPERNVLKEDKVAKSRRVCYLTLFNRSDAKWRRNSCRGSFFSASGCTGFLRLPLEGSHYTDCVRILRSVLLTSLKTIGKLESK